MAMESKTTTQVEAAVLAAAKKYAKALSVALADNSGANVRRLSDAANDLKLAAREMVS